MPQGSKEWYSTLMDTEPLLPQAGEFGWAQRRRFFFLHGPRGGLTDVPFDGFALHPTVAFAKSGDTMQLRYIGAKPLPGHVYFQGCFSPAIDPQGITRNHGVGAMHPFVREFDHPDDRCKEASPEANSRFFSDSRRFPPASYEEPSLVWKQEQWRQLFPEERAQINMIPPSAVEGAGATERSRAKQMQIRNSLIGNALHVPSIMLAFVILLQLLEPTEGLGHFQVPYCPFEFDLRERVRHTALQPGLIASIPGVLNAKQIIADMQLMLPGLQASCENQWAALAADLAKQPLDALQAYWADQWLQQQPVHEQGPQWRSQRQRACQLASFGVQRSSGDSKRGLDHLIEPGLGPDRHIRRAERLPNPFNQGAVTDSDTRWAAKVSANLGPSVQQHRFGQTEVSKRCDRCFKTRGNP